MSTPPNNGLGAIIAVLFSHAINNGASLSVIKHVSAHIRDDLINLTLPVDDDSEMTEEKTAVELWNQIEVRWMGLFKAITLYGHEAILLEMWLHGKLIGYLKMDRYGVAESADTLADRLGDSFDWKEIKTSFQHLSEQEDEDPEEGLKYQVIDSDPPATLSSPRSTVLPKVVLTKLASSSVTLGYGVQSGQDLISIHKDIKALLPPEDFGKDPKPHRTLTPPRDLNVLQVLAIATVLGTICPKYRLLQWNCYFFAISLITVTHELFGGKMEHADNDQSGKALGKFRLLYLSSKHCKDLRNKMKAAYVVEWKKYTNMVCTFYSSAKSYQIMFKLIIHLEGQFEGGTCS